MNFFLIIGTILMLMTAGAQAAVIVLKNGQTIRGDIQKQDPNDIIINVSGVTVTYYKDEVVSVDGAGVVSDNSAVRPDPNKAQLVEQYLKMFSTRDVVVRWVMKFHPDQRQILIPFLEQDQNITQLTELRKEGAMKYFSSEALKAAIDFYSSPQGEQYRKENASYQKDTMQQFYGILKGKERLISNEAIDQSGKP